MKNSQKGFLVPLVLAVIAVIAIGASIYTYNNKEVTTPATLDTKKVVSHPEPTKASSTTNVTVTATSSVKQAAAPKPIPPKAAPAPAPTPIVKSPKLSLGDTFASLKIKGARQALVATYKFDSSTEFNDSHVLLNSIQLPLYYSNGASPAFLTDCVLDLQNPPNNQWGSNHILNTSSHVNPQGNSGALQTFAFDSPYRSFNPNRINELNLYCDISSNATGTFQWGISSAAQTDMSVTYAGGNSKLSLIAASVMGRPITIDSLNEYPETTVTLISPNGGELWKVGMPYDIKWITSAPIPRYARLIIGLENTTNGDFITLYSSGKGDNSINKYTYTVPNNQPLVRVGEYYKVKVVIQDIETNTMNNVVADDYSNGYIQVVQ
jgi:hypothetical protein